MSSGENKDGRVLGVDPGSKRVGLAISSFDGTVALPLDVIRVSSLESVVKEIVEIAKSRNVSKIIIGHPILESGASGVKAEESVKLCELLRASTQIPVEVFDERYTTKIAKNALKELGIKEKKQRDRIDMLAATVLLESYLESTNGK